MPDLHAKIASELSRRLEVAKAATPGPWRGADWSASFGSPEETVTAIESSHRGPFPQIVLREEQPALVLHVEDDGGDFNANVAHIALHDPADSIRRYSSALRVLERHAIIHRNIGWLEPDDGWQGGTYAELPVCGRCVPKHSHFGSRAEVPEGACIEVRDLAASLGLDTEGSTDGQ